MRFSPRGLPVSSKCQEDQHAANGVDDEPYPTFCEPIREEYYARKNGVRDDEDEKEVWRDPHKTGTLSFTLFPGWTLGTRGMYLGQRGSQALEALAIH